ncbi:MAG: hypothetical protein K2K82_02525 [Muribaculaceae bacterium]|nr:hypothetical protein [Muribaculaceae bacterium]
MEKLSFHPIGLKNVTATLILIAYFLLSLTEVFCNALHDSVLLDHYYWNAESRAEEAALYSAIAGLISLVPLYFIFSWIRKSINDTMLSGWVNFLYYAYVAVSVMSFIVSISETDISEMDQPAIISLVMGVVIIVFNIIIAVRCISKGDSAVKGFGWLSLFVGFLIPLVLEVVLSSLEIRLSTDGVKLIFIIVSIITVCDVYPYFYLKNKIVGASEVKTVAETVVGNTEVKNDAKTAENQDRMNALKLSLRHSLKYIIIGLLIYILRILLKP